MNKIVKICKGRVMNDKIESMNRAVEDALTMAVERCRQICAEVRIKDTSVEFRAACDEISDRIGEDW